MKKIILLACVFLLSLGVNAFAGNCTALSLDLKEISRSTRYVDITFRTEVRNNGQAGTCFIPIQGVDNEGFEILTNTLVKSFSQNETRTLTERRSFPLSDYERVKEWRIK